MCVLANGIPGDGQHMLARRADAMKGVTMNAENSKPSRHDPAIESLAEESHVPIVDVEHLYQDELVKLGVGAGIDSFLPIFAFRNVREALRPHNVVKLVLALKPASIPPATLWKSLLGWFVMLLVAMANGAIRDVTYGRQMDELTADQISTMTGVVLLGIVIQAFVRRYPPASDRSAIALGLFWMALTVAFEFLYGHYVGARSWPGLFADYNLFGGRLWVVVLAWIAIAPYLFLRFSVLPAANTVKLGSMLLREK